MFTFGAFVRQDQYNYYPSNNPFADLTPDLQSETVGQNRRLTNAGARTTYSWVKHIHNMKVGATFEHTFTTEQDTFGLVDPTANAPCLNADGSPNTDPTLTNPNGCPGGLLNQNPDFVPILACYDLTRTARCPLPTDARVRRAACICTMATPTSRNWRCTSRTQSRSKTGPSISDSRRYLQRHCQRDTSRARLGIAYNIKPTNTVFRVSYARTLETPFNENLVLSSTGCNDAVIIALQSTITPAKTALR